MSPKATSKLPTRGRRALSWVLAFPDLALAALFFLIPLGVLVSYSFAKQDSLTQDVKIIGTLRAYRLLFSDLYRPVFQRSAALSLSCVVLCALIAIPASLAISRFSLRNQRRVLTAVLFPSFVSFTVRIYAWVGLLGNEGPLAGMTSRLVGHPIVLLYRPGSLLIGMVTAYAPLFVLPVVSSLQRIDRGILEAAADAGGSPGRVTRTITLPLAAPGIVTGAMVVSILALGEFLIPTVLGGGKVLLLGTLLAEQAGGKNKPLGGAIASTLIALMLIVAILGTLVRRALAQRNPEAIRA